MKAYDKMIVDIENAQNMKDYKAHRQIQNVLAKDTPVKIKDNRQYIDNIPTYDRDAQRIARSIHHKLNLGQNSSTTVYHCCYSKYRDINRRKCKSENRHVV